MTTEAYIKIGPTGTVEASIPIHIFDENGGYVARSPHLCLSSQGDSRQEAEDAIKEAISMFIEETIKMHTLGSSLQDLGWKKIEEIEPQRVPYAAGQSAPAMFAFAPLVSTKVELGPLTFAA